jgi:hypothetical protein
VNKNLKFYDKKIERLGFGKVKRLQLIGIILKRKFIFLNSTMLYDFWKIFFVITWKSEQN